MKETGLVKKCFAEFLGTFAIVFAGCGAVMVHTRFPGVIPFPGIPLIFGIVVTIMIYSLGHLSGAHFNPAVTLAFSAIRRFPKNYIFFYVLAQCLGSFVAMLILGSILPEGASYGATVPKGITEFQALVWEALLTFFLMFVVMGVAVDSRSEGAIAGVAIGATVALDAMLGGAITGASMNPARSLAPNLFEGKAEVLWVYFVGPIFGALSAAVLYHWLGDHEALRAQESALETVN